MVRNYTDKELLDRAKQTKGFQGIPKNFWILGVRSKADKPDVFDDKFYLFYGEKFVMVTTGTTNPGLSSLRGYQKWNKKGCAVMASDTWHLNVWRFGYHRGKMQALVQVRDCDYYRDGDKDTYSEEVGKLYKGKIGLNFHTATYNKIMSFIRKYVGGWSAGCQVANKVKDYYSIIDYCRHQLSVSYCLLKEF